ncbi:hypothetical protein ABFT80_14630 [Mesorhizobium sp. SB112]|uniref:DUF6894 family protein n=1 Tax=Mesorhizobium sp. SB112 TaxID=3151853 RepID=UPI0032678016
MRYYFDIHDGEEYTDDATGMECASLDDMRREAIAVLPSIAVEKLPDGNDRLFWVKVRDANGRFIFQASLQLKTEVL